MVPTGMVRQRQASEWYRWNATFKLPFVLEDYQDNVDIKKSFI